MATAVAPDPVDLEICASKDVALADARGMYDLVKGNMHDMYVEAGWGWDAAEKRREMEHRDARFVIARCRGNAGEEGRAARAAAGGGGGAGGRGESAADVAKVSAGMRAVTVEGAEPTGSIGDSAGVECDGNPARGGGGGAGDGSSNDTINGSLNGTSEEAVLPAEGEESAGGGLAGFCHFRFAWDEDENEDGEGVGGKEDVLYVYELQVAPWAKRRGLGRRMMQALEVRVSCPISGEGRVGRGGGGCLGDMREGSK